MQLSNFMKVYQKLLDYPKNKWQWKHYHEK